MNLSELKEFSDTQLLLELIDRNKSSDTSRHMTYCYPHKTITISIGTDECADIILSEDAIKELKGD